MRKHAGLFICCIFRTKEYKRACVLETRLRGDEAMASVQKGTRIASIPIWVGMLACVIAIAAVCAGEEQVGQICVQARSAIGILAQQGFEMAKAALR